nr:hypothetical protein [Tanacetum cinerariifolium]
MRAVEEVHYEEVHYSCNSWRPLLLHSFGAKIGESVSRGRGPYVFKLWRASLRIYIPWHGIYTNAMMPPFLALQIMTAECTTRVRCFPLPTGELLSQLRWRLYIV